MRTPRHRNSARDRERAELASLRTLVHELESHVAASRRGEISPLEARRSAWQSLSERQARARAAAEETNRALNERVQSNADWIQRLWELLHEKRRDSEASGSLRRMAALQRKAEDDLVLNQLKQQAQSAAPRVPDILVEHGVHLLGNGSVEGSLATGR
ncbi:hypothetical protein ON010_g5231 [Phytophthora cinnamomi]|nr:hypothetical protein ON010_g5231 [Phytophthora cinnamomi]